MGIYEYFLAIERFRVVVHPLCELNHFKAYKRITEDLFISMEREKVPGTRCHFKQTLNLQNP